jgi:sugar O-acyltransferase (sialic acid O-acetyltransferase NeuD family)
MRSGIPARIPLIMIGAGGHARVMHSLAMAAGYRIIGICDPTLTEIGESSWRGIPVLGADEALKGFKPCNAGVINGIGQLVGSDLRKSVFERIKLAGFEFPPLVHPSAWVAESVKLDEGVQVMAGVIIQPDSQIGTNTIVNTRASIDHDCHIGAHVHVAPGATLCGGVTVGDGTFIGSGSTIIHGISIGTQAVVGAGSVLTKNLMYSQKAMGIPARVIDNQR